MKCFHPEEGATFRLRDAARSGSSALRCRGGGAGVAARAHLPAPTSRCACACAAWFPHSSTPARWTRSCAGRSPPSRCRPRPRSSARPGGWRPRLPDAGLRPPRRRFLAAQLRRRRMACTPARRPARVRSRRRCAGASTSRRPREPDAYRAAHRELAALLPAARDRSAARLAAHRRRDAVPPERLGAAVRALSTALRARVAAQYGLPHRRGGRAPRRRRRARGARCTPTAAATGRSCEVNAGARPGAGRLPRLVAHETYPGHHVECCRGRGGRAAGGAELAVTVLGTPQTVVSEGTRRVRAGRRPSDRGGAVGRGRLAAAGVRTDGELAERLDPVLAVLRRVRLDAALLLHGDGRPTSARSERAEAHLRRWLLLDAGTRATRGRCAGAAAVADARRRRRRGRALVRDVGWTAASDPVAEHRRLLDDPLRAGCAARPNEYGACQNLTTGGSGSTTNGRPNR